MTEFKGHTPGPWIWYRYPDGRKLLIGKDNAVIHCPDGPMVCCEADQALIVAAPLLLAQRDALRAALQAVVDYDDTAPRPSAQMNTEALNQVMSQARAALARTAAPKEQV